MVFFLLFIGAIPWVSGIAQAQTGKELVAKGQYIFELAGGCALGGVVEDRGVLAFELPGVEEERPVDVLAQVERVEHELRCGDLGALDTPVSAAGTLSSARLRSAVLANAQAISEAGARSIAHDSAA